MALCPLGKADLQWKQDSVAVLCKVVVKVVEFSYCNSDLRLLKCSWEGVEGATGWQNIVDEMGVATASVPFLDELYIWMWLFALLVSPVDSIKDLPFVSDVQRREK